VFKLNKRGAPIVACVGLICAASAAASVTTSPARGTVRPCGDAQLRLHIGRGQGTAGTTFFPVRFTNSGARACTLRGYPGVSSVTSAHGHQIGDAALREPGFRVRRVVLRARGGVATAVYGQTDTGVFARSRCRPVHARGLRVFAPNHTAARFVRLPHLACSKRGVGDNRVRPVVAGRPGL
jgi:Domain of unknown function (DUF4232)